MAIIRTMLAVVGPLSGIANPASPATAFVDTSIDWPTLQVAATGAGYSTFKYTNANGTVAPCEVKNTVANIKGAFSVLPVA
jgi:hypothetical protein